MLQFLLRLTDTMLETLAILRFYSVTIITRTLAYPTCHDLYFSRIWRFLPACLSLCTKTNEWQLNEWQLNDKWMTIKHVLLAIAQSQSLPGAHNESRDESHDESPHLSHVESSIHIVISFLIVCVIIPSAKFPTIKEKREKRMCN